MGLVLLYLLPNIVKSCLDLYYYGIPITSYCMQPSVAFPRNWEKFGLEKRNSAFNMEKNFSDHDNVTFNTKIHKILLIRMMILECQVNVSFTGILDTLW